MSYLAELIEATNAKVLDVGSGPFTTVGTEQSRIKITACDILADEYKKLLDKSGITWIIPVEKQDMECLKYPDELFDIVHCRNALDHTVNPKDALKEMVRVCKPNGYVYLSHYPNVGHNNKYEGDHRWNIKLLKNDVQIGNERESFLLSEKLPEHSSKFENRMITSIWRKNA